MANLKATKFSTLGLLNYKDKIRRTDNLRTMLLKQWLAFVI